jgi:hypothetical protein
MTDFEPFKKRIWKCAQDNDRKGFDRWCMLLMQKGVKDFLWRSGWGICPENAEAVFDMFTSLSLKSHKEWLKAIGRGDAPPEDVSPAEGYLLCANMIRELIDENTKLKSGAV